MSLCGQKFIHPSPPQKKVWTFFCVFLHGFRLQLDGLFIVIIKRREKQINTRIFFGNGIKRRILLFRDFLQEKKVVGVLKRKEKKRERDSPLKKAAKHQCQLILCLVQRKANPARKKKPYVPCTMFLLLHHMGGCTSSTWCGMSCGTVILSNPYWLVL